MPLATVSPLSEANADSNQQSANATRTAVLLATWLSPGFPIGAFSYSHGLETAIADGRVRSGAALEDWIGLLVDRGSGWGDAVLLAEAWRAATAKDAARLAAVAELATAMAPSRERLLETSNLGAAFLIAVSAGWPHERISRLSAAAGSAPPYPIVVGLASAANGLPLEAVLAGFLNSFAGNLISVAVRLVPLGQTAGLEILGYLQPLLLATAGRAARSTLDDLGSAAILSDIAAMRHETLYSRVFRS